MTLGQQVKALRVALSQHDVVRFDRKDAAALWNDAIEQLRRKGFCEATLETTGEQSTELVLRRKMS